MPPSPPISRLEMTPNGHAVTQYPQPLQTSSWITTVPNSVRKIAPVGQTSRQPACVQCLQTSDSISHRKSCLLGLASRSRDVGEGAGPEGTVPRCTAPESPVLSAASGGGGAGLRPAGAVAGLGRDCSMKTTWRQVFALSSPVLS